MSISEMLDPWRHAKSLEEYQSEMRTNRRNSLTDNFTPPTIGRRAWNMCKSLPHSPITWMFLITLGCLSALLGSLMDYWIFTIVSLRQRMILDLGEDSLASYLVWVVWTVVCGVLASSCGYFISTNSDGSGIPQMKALLAGQLGSSNVLSYATLVARCTGTVLSNASGLSVGKEGPFLHIVSIMADKLSSLAIFRPTADNFTYIRAGVACGVTAVFGSPLGGVLFSIEVTSQYYAIKNLWQSVISSSVCVLTFQIISVLQNDVLFTNTKFADFELGWELLGFLLLGVLSGVLAATFVKCVQWLHGMKIALLERLARPLVQRYLHVAVACAVTGVLAYPCHLLRWTDRVIVNDMFKDVPLANLTSIEQSTTFSPHLYLLLYLGFKFAITLVPCGLPLSCGIFTPLFTYGAVVGRLYGELLVVLVSPTVSPATYAVVGAACFASAATHTVSTAVIVFELTGQLSHMLPVMLSVLVAYSIGGMSSPSIYDVFAKIAGLNFVCADITDSVLAHKMAHEMMRPVPQVLTMHSTYADAVALLQGAVRRVDLLLVLSRLAERVTANAGSIEDDDANSTSTSMLHATPGPIGLEEAAELLLHDKALGRQTIQFGPPYDVLSYTALPINTYPPQVGYFVALSNVYVLSCVYMWAQVFVVEEGVLVGLLSMDATLNSIALDEVVALPNGKPQ
ncbi:hypothetical protein, variant 1 [Aphanomyces invadans]|uniref:Chloride channel protein n=1 Tax=Aphanomyces invadans TaxID=157072 RepID=A0A024TLZ9_9STRA|nr:hypothetical protein, variant 1 [Aphanomyces invadans]ETV95009.1 hypothetical protein, variant 1 [Aphanomyces invadans]|eukprot:XP_008876183.1 hypothetical protein, variant 1 [Aphanomyces invadans]